MVLHVCVMSCLFIEMKYNASGTQMLLEHYDSYTNPAVLLMYNTCNPHDFRRLDDVLDWIYSGDKSLFTVVAVGTHCDVNSPQRVSLVDSIAHFSSKKPPIPYFDVSSMTGFNVEESVKTLVRLCIENLSQDANSSKCVIA